MEQILPSTSTEKSSSQEEFKAATSVVLSEVKEYLDLVAEAEALETQAAKKRRKARRLLEVRPVLGNILGAIKKEARKRVAEASDEEEAPAAPPAKKKKDTFKEKYPELASIEAKEEKRAKKEREEAERLKKKGALREAREKKAGKQSTGPSQPMEE